jgi:hypothetical protein
MIYWDMALYNLTAKYQQNCMVLHTPHICNSGTSLGWVVSDISQPLYPREWYGSHWTGVGCAPETIWTCVESLAPTGVRSLERPAHSESLYWLCYPSPPVCAAISHDSENIIADFRYKIYHQSSSWIIEWLPQPHHCKNVKTCTLAKIQLDLFLMHRSLTLSCLPLQQECTNHRHQVTQATKFFMVAHNICGSSVWNLLHVMLLALRLLCGS